MTDTGPPIRLRDDPGASAAGRALVGLELTDLGTYDVDAGLVAFEAAKAASGPPAATAGGAGAGKGIAGWIMVGVAGVGIAGGGILWGLGRGDRGEGPATASVQVEPTRADGPAEAADPKRPSPAREPAEADNLPRAEPERSEPRATDLSPEADTAKKRPRRPTAAATEGKASPGAEGGPTADEIEHTGRMRAALAEDPALALELAEAGDKEFPDGMFGRERLAYAILALAKLGRTDEATRRAEAFLKRYPRGPLAERVRAAVGADVNARGN